MNRETTRLSAFCDTALEAGWLMGVTITPVFFNVYSSRVFEPDKLTTLRALSTVLAVLWLVRFLEERLHQSKVLRFSWRTPLVLPALLTMGSYLLSSLFSLVPATSILGSYQRLQGTYTLFGYLVLFFAILTSLRTRAQLSRLITVLILNSLPISLYGIIQHNGLDPLPWAGDVTSRVASNMGNAIFVAAYLIMIVPLTAARLVNSFDDILHREQTRTSDILRASGYIFLLAVQILTIWYSQSRGPWLGIVAAAFLFPFLALLRLQQQAMATDSEAPHPLLPDLLRGIGLGIGSLLLPGVLVLLSMLAFTGKTALIIGGVLAALAFGAIWLYNIVERRRWRWLWISWGTIGLAAALTLVAINIPGYLNQQVLQISSIRRLATITQLNSGTGKVRTLIWEGTLDLISPHDPIQFPDGRDDPYNALRLLLGYGPESMYVAYNSFYPPELGHYESRTASPDRSHNETLDAVVVTGLLGLGVYLFTFGSLFYWGFRWLGFLTTRRQLWLYLALDSLFAIILFLIGWRLDGLHLFGVAIPLGILIGTTVYLALHGLQTLRRQATNEISHPHGILLIAVLASVLAHFVEINFGIAIAATRTTFWVLAALLVVLGKQWVPGLLTASAGEAETSQPTNVAPRSKRRSRRSKRRRADRSTFPPWLSAVLALALCATFLLSTLAFDFINNPERLSDPGEIFVRSLTMKYQPQKTQAYGALLIFLFTWALFGTVGLSEFDREGWFAQQSKQRWLIASISYAGISLVGLLIFGTLLASLQAQLTQVQATTLDQVVAVADQLSMLLGRYYGLIFILLPLLAVVLLGERNLPSNWGNLISPVVLVVLLLLGVAAIRTGCYNLIRADIIFKQGGVFANNRSINDKQIGIAHYEQALKYAPREDYYHLFLGKAYLELAQGLPEEVTPEQRTYVFAKTEEVLTKARELNPLNTDHSANLARFYKSWAARISMEARRQEESEELQVEIQPDEEMEQQQAMLQAQRDVLLQKSLENYRIALTLSPNNPILWNELALLYSVDLQDAERFQETVSKSLEVDDGFEQTWMLLGDMRSTKGDLAGAASAYQQALDIREDCTVRRALGTLQAQQEQWAEAISTLEVAVERCPKFRELWDVYRVQAIAYANLGQVDRALLAANQALEIAPESQKPGIQQLLNTLQGQPESESQP